MRAWKTSIGCAPDTIRPLMKTVGVDCTPSVLPFAIDAWTCDSYFALSRHALNFAASMPTAASR